MSASLLKTMRSEQDGGKRFSERSPVPAGIAMHLHSGTSVFMQRRNIVSWLTRSTFEKQYRVIHKLHTPIPKRKWGNTKTIYLLGHTTYPERVVSMNAVEK